MIERMASGFGMDKQGNSSLTSLLTVPLHIRTADWRLPQTAGFLQYQPSAQTASNFGMLNHASCWRLCQ